MLNPDLRELLSNNTSRYSLVIAVAKRAREISAENSEMGIVVDEKPVLAAIKDFENHKYAILEPDVND